MDVGSGVLSDAAAWAAIVGFFSPILIQFITSLAVSAKVQAALAFVSFVILGAGTNYFAGAFTGRSVVSSILLTIVVGMTTYEHVWKPLGVTPSTTSAP